MRASHLHELNLPPEPEQVKLVRSANVQPRATPLVRYGPIGSAAGPFPSTVSTWNRKPPIVCHTMRSIMHANRLHLLLPFALPAAADASTALYNIQSPALDKLL